MREVPPYAVRAPFRQRRLPDGGPYWRRGLWGLLRRRLGCRM